MPVTPNAENTFTIVRRPLKDSERKTLERLMTMQKDVQRGRTKLAERRGRENVVHGRGGRDWVVRKTVTKLVHVEIGQTFTIHVSHNILPDLAASSNTSKWPKPVLLTEHLLSSTDHCSNRPSSTPSVDPFVDQQSASRSAIGAMGHGKDDGVNQPHAVCSPG